MEKDIITLSAGEYVAKINLSRGANCISLRHLGVNANILREPNYENLDNPYLYGMPILYPNNRISGGRFVFDGRECVYPINEAQTNCHIHGFLHQTPFMLKEMGKDFAVCEYVDGGGREGLNAGQAFSVRIVYRLDKVDGLSVCVTIFNRSKEKMPNMLGFHTTFNVPFIMGSTKQDVRVLAEVKDEVERNFKNYLPTGKILFDDEITKKLCQGELYPFERVLSRQYFAANGGRIALKDKKNGISVVYEVDEKFPFRLIYNGNADEYICIEPQTCMANCPNAPFEREFCGFDYICAGENKSYNMHLYLKEDKEQN